MARQSKFIKLYNESQDFRDQAKKDWHNIDMHRSEFLKKYETSYAIAYWFLWKRQDNSIDHNKIFLLYDQWLNRRQVSIRSNISYNMASDIYKEWLISKKEIKILEKKDDYYWLDDSVVLPASHRPIQSVRLLPNTQTGYDY